MKDTGWKNLLKTSQYNFAKWGEYMKRAQLAERKVEKLKALMFLTDPELSHACMNELASIQIIEYCKEFPEEILK